jgi:hypothetical protein
MPPNGVEGCTTGKDRSGIEEFVAETSLDDVCQCKKGLGGIGAENSSNGVQGCSEAGNGAESDRRLSEGSLDDDKRCGDSPRGVCIEGGSGNV